MRPIFASFALPLALAFAPAASAEEPAIVFIAATNHTMPLSEFQDSVMTGGILKDLGDAIAQRLGRRARYLSLPPKRVPLYLANGSADGVCYIRPQWVDGDFNWTCALIPATGVLAARTDAPVAHGFADVAGKPIGTVAAYRYTNFEKALGAHFQRDDAPSQDSNVNKLLAGRMQYAILEKITYDFLARFGAKPAIRVDMEFEPIKAQCAFSKRSTIPFAEVDKAVNSLLDDGSVERILAKYR